ncbi:MAG TPA: hypothetical protein VNQ79_17655 [Blastocatellia bacterium]|nr:hypothetical protein [Blastocatellia bacterium]
MLRHRSVFQMLLLAGLLSILIRPGSAQQFQNEEERQLYQQYYNAVQAKDEAKACTLSQEFLAKYPQSQYAKYVRRTFDKCGFDQFQTALNNYYKAPDAAKLEALLAAGEKVLKDQPDQLYITTQMAIAVSRSAISGSYKDLEKARAMAEKTLARLESTTPPEGWQPEQYNALREAALVQLNQFLGWAALRQENTDPQQVLTYLNRAIEIKGKDGTGWKDPNNYWLRAGAYTKQYEKLKAQYDALSDTEKTGEAGRALLAQVDALVDKLIGDYARVVAFATQPQTQPLQQAAREQLEQFWKYKHNGKTEGLAEYIRTVQTDPNAPPPAAERKG